MQVYAVFMQWVAFQLEKRGFRIIKMRPNRKKPEYNIYYFEDTMELHKALMEITQNKK